MIRAFIIAAALSLLSLCVHAQTPDRSEAAQFAAIVSNSFAKLSDVIAERDEARAQVVTLQAQVAAVQKQLDEARATKPAPTPTPDTHP